MMSRTALSGLVPPYLVLVALAGCLIGADARPLSGAVEQRSQKLTPNAWVAMVVSRISRAGGSSEAEATGGSATLRIRIGADGILQGAAIEESSGSSALDERTLRAAGAASPFPPPPDTLLTLEGFTELSFAVEFGKGAGR